MSSLCLARRAPWPGAAGAAARPFASSNIGRRVHADGLLKGMFGGAKEQVEQAVDCTLFCGKVPAYVIYTGGEISHLEFIFVLYAVIDVEKVDFGPDPESIVLSEVERGGGKAKIVYRPGGEVDVGELANLCAKVGWPKRPSEKVAGALENSYLVCPLPQGLCHSSLCNRDLLNTLYSSLPRRRIECHQHHEKWGVLRVPVHPTQTSLPYIVHRCMDSMHMQQGPEVVINFILKFRVLQVCTLELVTEGSQGETKKLIGLARATSDHVFNATVWDVLVDPEFQGQVRSVWYPRNMQQTCNFARSDRCAPPVMCSMSGTHSHFMPASRLNHQLRSSKASDSSSSRLHS